MHYRFYIKFSFTQSAVNQFSLMMEPANFPEMLGIGSDKSSVITKDLLV
jgi:hypothetical protein